MDKLDIFSIFVKMAMILLLFEAVTMFWVVPGSAEFYVLIFSMILMFGVIVFGFFKSRKDKKSDE